MARQHGGPRKATAVAAAAIEWGDPILSSAVSTVVEGRLYYRGRDAVRLSEGKAFEEVARILWSVDGVDGQRRSTSREGCWLGSKEGRAAEGGAGLGARGQVAPVGARLARPVVPADTEDSP